MYQSDWEICVECGGPFQKYNHRSQDTCDRCEEILEKEQEQEEQDNYGTERDPFYSDLDGLY